jgi:hypothetical protein
MKDVMLIDRDGTLWTVGAGSGAWYRLEERKWIKSIPPASYSQRTTLSRR